MTCRTGTRRKELFVVFDVDTSREVQDPLPATSMLRHPPYLDVWPAIAMAWFDFRHRLSVKGLEMWHTKSLPTMSSAQVSLCVCSLSDSNPFQMKL